MLNKKEILGMIEKNKLVENYVSLEKQLTPNGIDLTVGEIFQFEKEGAVDFSNKERVIPQGEKIKPVKVQKDDQHGWWQLKPGVYKVRTNEIINMANNLVAFAFTRTSLLRMGAFTQNGVWDAGFSGKSEFVLVVQNPYGIKIKENARVVQLVFLPVDQTEAYQGIYQNLGR